VTAVLILKRLVRSFLYIVLGTVKLPASLKYATAKYVELLAASCVCWRFHASASSAAMEWKMPAGVRSKGCCRFDFGMQLMGFEGDTFDVRSAMRHVRFRLRSV
jgi:hypothetical protein